MGERAQGHSLELHAQKCLGFIVASCVCLTLAAVFAAGTMHRAQAPRLCAAAERINPNDASAASLARLPGIGPTRAGAIVAFRERFEGLQGGKPVFRRAEDLAQVKGIGPVTIEELRPWLMFDPPSGDGNEPALR